MADQIGQNKCVTEPHSVQREKRAPSCTPIYHFSSSDLVGPSDSCIAHNEIIIHYMLNRLLGFKPYFLEGRSRTSILKYGGLVASGTSNGPSWGHVF